LIYLSTLHSPELDSFGWVWYTTDTDANVVVPLSGAAWHPNIIFQEDVSKHVLDLVCCKEASRAGVTSIAESHEVLRHRGKLILLCGVIVKRVGSDTVPDVVETVGIKNLIFSA
jgi:hypothetical protein